MLIYVDNNLCVFTILRMHLEDQSMCDIIECYKIYSDKYKEFSYKFWCCFVHTVSCYTSEAGAADQKHSLYNMAY